MKSFLALVVSLVCASNCFAQVSQQDAIDAYNAAKAAYSSVEKAFGERDVLMQNLYEHRKKALDDYDLKSHNLTTEQNDICKNYIADGEYWLDLAKTEFFGGASNMVWADEQLDLADLALLDSEWESLYSYSTDAIMYCETAYLFLTNDSYRESSRDAWGDLLVYLQDK